MSQSIVDILWFDVYQLKSIDISHDNTSCMRTGLYLSRYEDNFFCIHHNNVRLKEVEWPKA